MYTLLFYYTLVIMLFYTIVASINISAYFVSRRKTFLFAAIAFIFYFFDVSLVFKDDFVTPQAIYDAASFYDVGNPLITIFTGAGAFLFLWLAICSYLDERRRLVQFGPIIGWCIASFAAYQLIGDHQWREFIFYSMREVLLFFSFALLAMWYANDESASRRAMMYRHRTAFGIAFILTVGILVENIYIQLIFDPSTVPSDIWFFAERSIMENMLFVCFGVTGLIIASQMLRLRYEQPPERDDARANESIDRVLPFYCERHDLSKREGEVLRFIIQGKDNQNIASEMHLALSTVKVHVHNILKKTEQPDRKELTKDFWRS